MKTNTQDHKGYLPNTVILFQLIPVNEMRPVPMNQGTECKTISPTGGHVSNLDPPVPLHPSLTPLLQSSHSSDPHHSSCSLTTDLLWYSWSMSRVVLPRQDCSCCSAGQQIHIFEGQAFLQHKQTGKQFRHKQSLQTNNQYKWLIWL
jgi:hypothetical protein